MSGRTDSCSEVPRSAKGLETLSDTVTLIAGVLLTSAGLLAVLPYVLKQGWRTSTGGLAVDSGYASVLAAVDAFEGSPLEVRPEVTVAAEDVEELLAHLFSLRMTVSEATAELQDLREALGEGPARAGTEDEAQDETPKPLDKAA